MNATSGIEPLQVGVADPIRKNPGLDEAVKLATQRFEQLLEEYDAHEARRTMIWGCSDPLESDGHIILNLREQDEFGHRDFNRMTSPKKLLDPLRREGFLLDLLIDVLQKRWRKVNEKRYSDLRTFEAAEMEHGH